MASWAPRSWPPSAPPASGTTSSEWAPGRRWRSSSTAGTTLDTFAKPAGIPYPHGASQFDHLSLNLPDEAALEDLQRRLKEHDCEVTDVVDHGFIRSIYFNDPTGIALEASYWTLPLDEGAHSIDYSDEQWFHDEDPVPAVREIVEQGAVSSTPSTRLVDRLVTPAP